MALNSHIANSIEEISPIDWDELFSEELVEDRGYHKTIAESGIKEFSLYYLIIRREDKTTAILPFFTMDFSLATLIQGPLQKLILRIQKSFKQFLKFRVLFVGFPTTEEMYLGISEGENLDEIFNMALRQLQDFSKDKKIYAIIFYNLTQQHSPLRDFLKKTGFTKMESFPNTMIKIAAKTLDEYINSLSQNMRKDLRRKLKRASELASLRTEVRDNVDGLGEQIYNLYLNNLTEADVSLETLTPEFFQNISSNMPGKVKFFLTFDKDKLVAFNLCLVNKDKCIDKFVGFDSRVCRLYHLYHTTFCHNIDWCIKNGLSYYQMGVTDYHPKLRLGAKLIPLYAYFKFRNPAIDLFSGLIAKVVSPKNFDPALRNIKE